MRQYIEKLVDTLGYGNCKFWVVAQHVIVGEDSYEVIYNILIKVLTSHKSDYMSIFESEERFQYIFNGLYPPLNNRFAPKEKWLTLPNMDYIISTSYNKVVF